MQNEKKKAALEAVKEIKDGMVVGLGTGSTAFFAIEAVGELVKRGMKLQAVPTSEHTKQLAESLYIPITDINRVETIDITIDGADEFTPNLDLIKGGGGALLLEKVVASLTQKQIIIADSSKLVETLGAFKLPVEVIPFACAYVLRQLQAMGGKAVVRMKNNQEYITDQGNYIIDVDFGLIKDPSTLDKTLNNIVGVVEHGLFLGLAHKVIMARGEEVIVYTK